MTACNAVGSIEVGGVSVAAVRCTELAGHGLLGIPLGVELTWTDETIADLPDLALLDPDESFVDVPIAEPLDAEG